MLVSHVFILIIVLPFLVPKCIETSKNHILFISDYVKWRNISYMILLDHDTNFGCTMKMVKDNLNMFVAKNIYFVVHSSIKYSEETLNRTKEHTAVITFLESNFSSQNFLEQANKITHYGGQASWLILATCHFPSNIMDILRFANFGLDSDVVIAIDTYKNTSSNQTANNTEFQLLERSQQPRLFKSTSNQTILNTTIECSPNAFVSNLEFQSLYQVYKIRKTYNSSLVVRALGVWDSVNTTKNLKPFWDVEKRGNFFQFPIIVGQYDIPSAGLIKESDVDINKMHFVNYFSLFLNSSKISMGYLKLGHRENGEWTDLLDDIVDEDIDISGQGISKTTERINDMAYTFDILKNMRNIYIKPEESQTLRDIFLIPFDSRLFLCVIGTCLILSIVMTINNFTDGKLGTKDIRTKTKQFSESLVWCVGILSQQGSIWTARSYTEKIIVIVALVFTVMIYNSYSAFITSVLSVELHSIRSVNDLLESDYKIGYAKESLDEDYLRSVNISELKQIYLRGYLQNDINNISEGLVKVTKGNFALFASGQVARTEIWNMTKSRCKFEIDEIHIQETVEYMGFVMSKKSTFKKLINLSIIKMYETGVYKQIYSVIYPDLVKCENKKIFQSARLADLSTAFFIIIFGWSVCLIMLISECLWKKRREIYINLKKRITNNEVEHHHNMVDVARLRTQQYKFANKSTLILPPTNKNVRRFDFGH